MLTARLTAFASLGIVAGLMVQNSLDAPLAFILAELVKMPCCFLPCAALGSTLGKLPVVVEAIGRRVLRNQPLAALTCGMSKLFAACKSRLEISHAN